MCGKSQMKPFEDFNRNEMQNEMRFARTRFAMQTNNMKISLSGWQRKKII